MSNQKRAQRPLRWPTAAILDATGGDLKFGQPDTGFADIAIDSRTIGPDDFFIAIRGDVHDGHTFAPAVLEQGIRGIMIDAAHAAQQPDYERYADRAVCVVVKDTTHALGTLAAYHQRRCPASVIAITGSNGKTTTRAMTSTVVSQRFPTLSTIGNYNNEIGVPLSLLRLGSQHAWAVLELGMNHPGEISRLAQMCHPQVGVITNVAPAHLEGVSSIEGVAQAKGELLDHLVSDGKAILNQDDPHVAAMAQRSPHEIIWYGLTEAATVRAAEVTTTAQGSTFRLHLPDAQARITLPIPGAFMVINALAAAAVGHTLGLDIEQIQAGLAQFKPVAGRMNIRRLNGGVTLIDDTYNANPGSMKAALQTLQTLRGASRGLFVAGDMLELGHQAEALHHEVGAFAARTGVAALFATGPLASHLAEGARHGGLAADHIHIGSQSDIVQGLRQYMGQGDWILIKGSRGMKMEVVVQAITGEADATASSMPHHP
jgi:UDP-N-acetylmuramoyl-tripeptide--D-alanyl-D-alanine ligase